ncbi:MAG: metallophosphatase [Rhodospirillales bacterium]|nr:metallophosphatase [Rhodospirillales bacterium]
MDCKSSYPSSILGPASTRALSDSIMILAQLSDPHICAPGQRLFARADTAGALADAVARLNGLATPPNLVVVTGDLTEHGTPEEYGQFQRVMAPLAAPYVVLPGNHDRRQAMRDAFPELPAVGPFHYTVEDFPVRLICLDSLIEGSGRGQIGPEQLAWLDRTLKAAPERPTVVALHHPPFSTGIHHVDAVGLDDAEAFGTIVAAHGQVERVIAGHVHRAMQRRWFGTIASTAPSTTHAVDLDLRPGAGAAYIYETPGLQLLHWRPWAGLVGHILPLGRFDGPHRYGK